MKINNLILGLGLVFIPLFSCQSQQGKEKTSSETVNKAIDVSGKSDAVVKTVEHLTAVTFKQKVFNYEINKEWKFIGNKPAIIDFYADWCGPCKRVAPTVAQIAQQYQGKVDVYKINVDEEKELASSFGINSIPSILFIPVSGQPQMSTGIMGKDEFDKMIKEFLNVN